MKKKTTKRIPNAVARATLLRQLAARRRLLSLKQAYGKCNERLKRIKNKIRSKRAKSGQVAEN